MPDQKVKQIFDRILGKKKGGAAPPRRAPLEKAAVSRPISAPEPASTPEPSSNILELCPQVEEFHFILDFSKLSRTQVPEEYRTLKTNVQKLSEEKGRKSFIISSAHHGEGKTTTAVALAKYLGLNRENRVLLVDADLRRPHIRKFLSMQPDFGLDDILEYNVPTEQCVTYSIKDNFAVLPSRKGHSNAPELMELPRMKHLPAELEASFDYVLYDTPPVLSTTDPAMLGAHTGGIILVIKAGATQREAVLHARSLLEQAGCTVDGIVLTQRKEYLPRYFYRYQYYRDYSYYYHKDKREEVPQPTEQPEYPEYAEEERPAEEQDTM